MKKSNEFVAIGLMLFALFFGAGNLIFPVSIGQNAGVNVVWATLGFLITGVGLPFVGVLATCYSGLDLEALASRVSPWYGLLFAIALNLTIGPFFAIPRTATVSYEIAVAPLLSSASQTIGLYAFAFAFFALSWWLAITPGKMVDRIGKIITPLLLFFLAILIGAGIFNPMGSWQAPTALYATPVTALVQGVLDGYNTMDALASLVFGVVVVQSVKMFGKTSHEEVTLSCFRAGLLSTVIMAIIYGSLSYLGANSVTTIGIQENGAPVLVKMAMHYFGSTGSVVLGFIVILACLTTSVGLIASCAAYFHLLVPRINHVLWATIFSCISFGVALFGLTTIISAAIPVLMLLYPMTIALITLAFADRYFGGSRAVYASTMAFTFIPSLYTGLNTAGISMGCIYTLMSILPLAQYNLAWISFSIIGFILGILIKKISR